MNNLRIYRENEDSTNEKEHYFPRTIDENEIEDLLNGLLLALSPEVKLTINKQKRVVKRRKRSIINSEVVGSRVESSKLYAMIMRSEKEIIELDFIPLIDPKEQNVIRQVAQYKGVIFCKPYRGLSELNPYCRRLLDEVKELMTKYFDK